MPLIILLMFILTSCVSVTYKHAMDDSIGSNINYVNHIWGVDLISQSNHQEYSEYAMKFISPFSKTQGICTTIFKVRKSDNIIVSWRSEGKNSDCVWRSSTE